MERGWRFLWGHRAVYSTKEDGLDAVPAGTASELADAIINCIITKMELGPRILSQIVGKDTKAY